MDPTELNFEIEYQKQFSRQALFEDIAKHSWSKTCAPRFCSAAIPRCYEVERTKEVLILRCVAERVELQLPDKNCSYTETLNLRSQWHRGRECLDDEYELDGGGLM
jgi:hypothetical protein